MTSIELLKRVGLKKTQQRIKLLDILKDADAPMTAEQLYVAICDESVSLSTIYRALEQFCACEIVEKDNILNSDKFYYSLADNGHSHYIVCLSCKNMHYIDICPVQKIVVDGFTVIGHKLELYGYCGDCSDEK